MFSPDSTSGLEALRTAIRSKYTEVSLSAAGKFGYPTGREAAQALGYDPTVIASAPARFFESSCGVGNPFMLGEVRNGDAVLDIGCGAGFDLFVAGRLTGQGGRICGIDLTDAMVIRARENLALAGMADADIRVVSSEVIPYKDCSFNVVISNGVINLSPHKLELFREIHRVLLPGGRFQFADIILERSLPEALAGSADAWAQ